MRDYVGRARDSLQIFREAPSNYAEVKTYGSTPINHETVAAIYSQPGMHPDMVKQLRAYAASKKIPFLQASANKRLDFERAVQEQNRALRE
jgi:hypothetical protein